MTGPAFRMVAEEAKRFPAAELHEQANAESKAIDAFLESATKTYDRLKQEDAEL